MIIGLYTGKRIVRITYLITYSATRGYGFAGRAQWSAAASCTLTLPPHRRQPHARCDRRHIKVGHEIRDSRVFSAVPDG